jgi:hypothetical protein
VPSVSLPTIAAVTGIAGAVTGAAGAVYGGLATANAASYQAQVAKVNQQIANQNAQYAIEAGTAKTAQVGEQAAQRAGMVKASLAANGVDVNTGSAVDVETGERKAGVLDEQTTMNNAELEAYGYKSQATSYGAQAGLEGMEAEQAPIGADLGAAGSLLSSASSLSTKWTGGGGAGSSGGYFLPIPGG